MRTSAIKEFMQCRRKWALQYVQGWSPREDETTDTAPLGVEVHRMLEAWLKGEPYDTEDELARTMVEGYIETVETEGWNANIEVVEVEKVLEVPAPHFQGENITCRLDWVYRDHDRGGGIVIGDFKTVQSLTQLPEQVDTQLRTYAWAWWMETGEIPVAVSHDMLRRVKRTGRSNPPFYMRYAMAMDEQQLLAHEQHLGWIFSEMHDCRPSDLTHPSIYPNPTKDCSWRCGFQSVCGMIDDGSDYKSVLQLGYERSEQQKGSTR